MLKNKKILRKWWGVEREREGAEGVSSERTEISAVEISARGYVCWYVRARERERENDREGRDRERQTWREKESLSLSVGISAYLMYGTHMFLHISYVTQSISSSQNNVWISLSLFRSLSHLLSLSFSFAPIFSIQGDHCGHPFQWKFDVSLRRVVGRDGLEREWAWRHLSQIEMTLNPKVRGIGRWWWAVGPEYPSARTHNFPCVAISPVITISERR